MCLTWMFMRYKENERRKAERAKYAARGLPYPGDNKVDSGYASGQQRSFQSGGPGQWDPPRAPPSYQQSPPKPLSPMQVPPLQTPPKLAHPYAAVNSSPLSQPQGRDPIYANVPITHAGSGMVAR